MFYFSNQSSDSILLNTYILKVLTISLDTCQPQCGNGGVCIGHNLCSCPHGYSGPACEDKTCTVRCENGGVCTMPNNKCKCRDGYYGTRCHKK